MKINVSDIFGSNVFNDGVMRARLPKAVYKDLKKTIEDGRELNPDIADVVANEMKEWAIEKGATHYTHWFQPMTGITAEKHDAFMYPTGDGKALNEFSGKELIKGESDASSFPSGGLRATFEARGYTTWDCTSPAFIKEAPNATILCIPTAFCSYTGEALDKKTPLLRSIQALNIQAIRFLRLFGNTTSKNVYPSVGAEQEYFLIDKEKFNKRKDLTFTGRTLFGAMPPKGQELDDHYFGTIHDKVAKYMEALNIELWKLGISAKTQHNEAAPAQHELAPIHDKNNIAADHNQIIMEMMKTVADRQGLVCLLHEKPFAGINGSGKHDNWSMVTDDGINLLNPGKTPHQNTQFLLLITLIMKAVDTYAGLLRVSAACPGNDHRLGAAEAPPAIISIFLGEQLEDILRQLDTTGEATHLIKGSRLESGVDTLPNFRKDATDRNRTSPFAFTGNKFEFRMVGSSQSISDPNVVINTIVAEVLCQACDELEKAENFDLAVHDMIKDIIAKHKRIVFSGNGYSEEWVEEAARRGLPNLGNTVSAIPEMIKPEAVKLFEKHGVYTEVELNSQVEVMYERYSKIINIEALAMIDMAKKQIIPAVIKYQTSLAQSINQIEAACPGMDTSVQKRLMNDIAANLAPLYEAMKKLEAEEKIASKIENGKEQANYFYEHVFKTMSEVRKPADALEMLVAKEDWPFPSYGDMLFDN